jgi:hypothetical protein
MENKWEITSSHSGRAVCGTKCLHQLKHWDSGFEFHLRHGSLCLCYPVYVAVLRLVDSQSMESYRLFIKNSVAWVRERTMASGRRLLTKLVPTFAIRGCHVVSVTDPYGRILGFLDRSRYFLFQVAPQLYSIFWVDPVPDPQLLCSQKLWPLDHRGCQE